jgi:peptide/nickel transport system substrate-binding protein
MNIFQRLVDRNETDDGYVGVLAESWENSDEGITFKIRQSVKFHDGQDLKASDVVFSLKKGSSYAGVNFGWAWINFNKVEALDEYTVYVPYHYPCGLTLAAFAANNMYILSEETWNKYREEISLHPNGTGPFKLSDWVQGDHCTLERFNDYWGDPAKLETINFRFIAENSQAIIELETGGVDVVMDVIPLEVPNIEASVNMEIQYGKPIVLDMVHMNNTNEYFKDVRIRQAVAYAINLEDILNGAYRGWGQNAYSFVTPSIVGYSNQFEPPNYPYGTTSNVEKAKELLTAAGYPNGFSIEITIDDDSNRIAVAEILRYNLEKVGIKATIVSSDYATFSEKIYSGKAVIYLNGVNANSMEPDSAFYQRWHSSNIKDGGSNYTRFNNAEFDKLLDEARKIPELLHRKETYAKAQAILIEQVPSVPYYVRQAAAAKVPNLKGIRSYAGENWLSRCYFE